MTIVPPKVWMLTEKYNIFLFMGTFIFVMVFVDKVFDYSSTPFGVILSGIMLMIFYDWEYVDN